MKRTFCDRCLAPAHEANSRDNVSISTGGLPLLIRIPKPHTQEQDTILDLCTPCHNAFKQFWYQDALNKI